MPANGDQKSTRTRVGPLHSCVFFVKEILIMPIVIAVELDFANI